MSHIDRRSFLASLGVLGLAACRQIKARPTGAVATKDPAGLIPLPPGRRTLKPIGIQMYTVRTQGRADLPKTLAELSRIGFREVEWWGSYPGFTPPQIKALLDQNGLAAPSVHIGIPRDEAGWAPIFESARALKHDWIVAASPPSSPKTTDEWKELGAAFNRAGKKVRDAGFRFAFHNHSEGMKLVDGVRPFEVMLKEADPELVAFELDVHWAYAGGADALDLISRYPARFRMMHIKDSTGAPDFTQRDVGAGTYPWPKILSAAAAAGFEHYFIEHDSPADAMVFAQKSYDYLAALKY